MEVGQGCLRVAGGRVSEGVGGEVCVGVGNLGRTAVLSCAPNVPQSMGRKEGEGETKTAGEE